MKHLKSILPYYIVRAVIQRCLLYSVFKLFNILLQLNIRGTRKDDQALNRLVYRLLHLVQDLMKQLMLKEETLPIQYLED